MLSPHAQPAPLTSRHEVAAARCGGAAASSELHAGLRGPPYIGTSLPPPPLVAAGPGAGLEEEAAEPGPGLEGAVAGPGPGLEGAVAAAGPGPGLPSWRPCQHPDDSPTDSHSRSSGVAAKRQRVEKPVNQGQGQAAGPGPRPSPRLCSSWAGGSRRPVVGGAGGSREPVAGGSRGQEGLLPCHESQDGLLPCHESQEGLQPCHETQEGLQPCHESQEGLQPCHESQEGLLPCHESQEGLLPCHESQEGLLPCHESQEVVCPSSVPCGSTIQVGGVQHVQLYCCNHSVVIC